MAKFEGSTYSLLMRTCLHRFMMGAVLLLCCVVGAYAASVKGKTLFLQPNNDWKSNGAWFQIYYWDDSNHSGWVTMGETSQCGVYAATIPTTYNYNHVIFCRTQGGKPAGNWDYVWTQTSNLSPTTSQNKYDITGWSTGTWYTHGYVAKGTRIYYDNSKTGWADIYMSAVCGCNNSTADINSYSPKTDCQWYHMTKLCGNIYYADLTADSYGLFSFFSANQSSNNNVYAASALLHYGYSASQPCFIPENRGDFNTSRQGYEWTGRLKSLPSTGMNADPMSPIIITSNKSNPVARGTTVQLQTESSNPNWHWYTSTDGSTWTAYTGATSGTHNRTITPAPTTSTYYQVRDNDNICNATYRIEVDIPCGGNQMTLLDLNFDTDESNQYFTSYSDRRAVIAAKNEAVNTSVYAFSPKNYEILDGWYAILANPYYGGRGSQVSSHGCHTTTCLKQVRSSGDYWYVNLKDHTHGGSSDGKIGGMLMANCKDKGEMIFRYKTPKLCGKNLYMTLSAWFANAAVPASKLPINAKIKVFDEDEADEIAHIDITDLQAGSSWANSWVEGRTAFFSGDNDYLYIKIYNYGESGTGNDILIDDIKFTACMPRIDVEPTATVDCGDITTITVKADGIEDIFQGTPYYLWQQWDYRQSKWVSIADDPVSSPSSHGGSGWGKEVYDFDIYYYEPTEEPKFRVIMSNDRDVAHQVGGGSGYACVNYAMTDDIIVDCNCIPQTITRNAGSITQTKCEGTAISSVVYTAGGVSTTGVGVKDLPTGLTLSKSGKSATVKGTLPVCDKDTTYVIKVFAEGTEGVACPSDTLILTINAKQKPSLTLKTGDDANQKICYSQADIEDIHYIWGGSATGVSLTLSPTSVTGLTLTQESSDKTGTVSGSPSQTVNYTIATTGQNSVCTAATKSGTITVEALPGEPGVKYIKH